MPEHERFHGRFLVSINARGELNAVASAVFEDFGLGQWDNGWSGGAIEYVNSRGIVYVIPGCGDLKLTADVIAEIKKKLSGRVAIIDVTDGIDEAKYKPRLVPVLDIEEDE